MSLNCPAQPLFGYLMDMSPLFSGICEKIINSREAEIPFQEEDPRFPRNEMDRHHGPKDITL